MWVPVKLSDERVVHPMFVLISMTNELSGRNRAYSRWTAGLS